MKIVITTNIDKYRTNCFPSNLVHVPRVGEKIAVTSIFESYFQGLKLPTILEVKSVIHTEHGILCEVGYSKNDVEFAKQNNINLF